MAVICASSFSSVVGGGWACRHSLGSARMRSAYDAAGFAPGVVELYGFPHGPRVGSQSLGHAPAMPGIDARHRHQETHRDLRADLALAYLLLDHFRQLFHQRQPARHPRGAAIEAPRQFLDRTAQAAFHFREQPTLFERGLRWAGAQRPLEHQRFGFAHLPHHGVDGVAAQLLERGETFVPVDDEVAAGCLFDDDDRCLLAIVSQ